MSKTPWIHYRHGHRARIMNNASETLWPGSRQHQAHHSRRKSVTVPSAGWQRSQSGNYVFCRAGWQAHVQPVKVDRTFQGVRIAQAFRCEDVIVDGQLLLSEAHWSRRAFGKREPDR